MEGSKMLGNIYKIIGMDNVDDLDFLITKRKKPRPKRI